MIGDLGVIPDHAQEDQPEPESSEASRMAAGATRPSRSAGGVDHDHPALIEGRRGVAEALPQH
jgi:hypothetical protein